MLNRIILSISLLLTSAFVSAEIRPFINGGIGFGDTDFDNGLYFNVGGGVQFNEHIEIEVGYNDYGGIGPFEIDIDSLSYGVNLGGNLSENVRLFAVLGAERLEADDTVSLGSFTIDIDESSTEAFFGIGVAFMQGENFDIRTKLVSHDSGDLITVNVGIAIYF
ncbi:porin family protein [Exilibacterium tricleocarpae]|uniref:Porin family protein n=1 Tax=Exilibacterium tricleocarpae TaxID=2591008 RepID=A0A545TZJ7_9GAMM|nr:outer membrane beta-barrel protein [Exilibacterium tricleocarpae]TQV82640.1 porin family protein [Exilibacterium tricleocarpae]